MTGPDQVKTPGGQARTSDTHTAKAQAGQDVSAHSDGDDTVPGTTDEQGMPVDNPSG